MLHFVIRVLTFILAQSTLAALMLSAGLDRGRDLPFVSSSTIKHHRLCTAPSPRVIFVGGSNLLFGIDSVMIAEQTQYHPVNMGLLGGLRIEYPLREIMANVRAGDLIVLSFEYGVLNLPQETVRADMLSGVVFSRPANLAYLTFEEWRQLLDRGALDELGRLMRHATNNLIHPADGPSTLAHFNQFGDLTLYHNPDINPPREGRNRNTVPRLDGVAVRKNIDLMNAYIREYRRRGAEVVFLYPPVPADQMQRRRQVAMHYDRLLRARLHAQLLLTPEEMTFDLDEFLGPSYHLWGNAVRQRTQMIIDAMNRLPISVHNSP